MNVDEFLRHEMNRRQFLGRSARNAAGVAAGMVGLSAGTAVAGSSAERLRLGVVGVRQRGLRLATQLAGFRDAEVVACCDVDAGVLAKAVKSVGEVGGVAPRAETDFRRLLDDATIDAVVVATPDHWHAAITIAACEAGKDVYVEAPLAHTLGEGWHIVEAAARSGRIVQTGLHHRSGEVFSSAVEFVRRGELGTVHMARAWAVHRRRPIGIRKATSAPEGVDYTAWLGPAASRPFHPNRFHGNWKWFWDYGSGELGYWGVHLLDVAAWGLGVQWPERVSAAGGCFHLQDDRETPDTLLVTYSFPERTIVWEHRQWALHGFEGRSAAVAFYGERGTLIVDRSGWKVYGGEESAHCETAHDERHHLRNFLDCVRSRKRPSAPVDVGQLAGGFCHLGNVAYRLGREVSYNPHQRRSGDADADRLLG